MEVFGRWERGGRREGNWNLPSCFLNCLKEVSVMSKESPPRPPSLPCLDASGLRHCQTEGPPKAHVKSLLRASRQKPLLSGARGDSSLERALEADTAVHTAHSAKSFVRQTRAPVCACLPTSNGAQRRYVHSTLFPGLSGLERPKPDIFRGLEPDAPEVGLIATHRAVASGDSAGLDADETRVGVRAPPSLALSSSPLFSSCGAGREPVVRSGVWPFGSALMFGVLFRDGSRTNRMGPAAVVVRGKKEQKQFCLAAVGTGAQTLLPDWRREVLRRSLTLLGVYGKLGKGLLLGEGAGTQNYEGGVGVSTCVSVCSI